MAWSLRDLIRASGFAGVAGQSFRNNVAGAGPGARMSDYKVTGWSFSGEPVPEINYSEGAAFSIAVDFSQGLLASYIKRLGNTISITAGLSPFGFSVYNPASSVVGAASGSSVSFNVHAPYASGVTYTATKWYVGYVSPNEPPNGDPADVKFQGVVQADPASGTDSVSVQLQYDPDIGPFNPTVLATFPFTMNKRQASTDPDNYDWEWHLSSNYTDADPITSPSFIIQSNPQETHTYYLRAKMPTDGVWNNVGAVIFVDNRDVSA